MRSIYPLTQTKTFSHDEAFDLIPLLTHLCSNTKKELNSLNTQLTMLKTNSEKAQNIQNQINVSIQSWSDKVRRLGGIPVSLCKVRLPSEEGHYFWEYPENRLFIH